MSQINLTSQAKMQQMQLNEVFLNQDVRNFNFCDVNQEESTACGEINLVINGLYVSFEFDCNIAIEYEKGEEWGCYTYCEPSAEISDVYNIKKEVTSIYDADDNEILAEFSAEILTEVDELITEFVCVYAELDAGNNYERFSDVV